MSDNGSATTHTDSGLAALPGDDNMSALPNAIVEWRKVQDEMSAIRAQIREKQKRAGALEDFIMRIMKKHNIDSLGLKNSGGRIAFRSKKRLQGLGPNTLKPLLTAHFQSEEKADAALKYINDNRTSKQVEKIVYEPTAFE
jgi:hypothetical protein